jgi:aryl-alcohol dehydrogenase-like predicted oxidoreductase
MRYKLFGRSGLRVSELCLGTMTFGEGWGWGANAAACKAMFDLFANAGGNFIDTAHMYTDGVSETLVGELVAADRDHFVIATKYTPSTGTDISKSGNSLKNMRRSVEESLRRLKTDHIDLYYLHYWDFTTPIDEIMRGLSDLVSSGKVTYVAVSDTPAWQIARANMLADLRGWAPFIGIQIAYSLLERTPERDILPMAKELDLGVTAWGALAGGVLSGKYNDDPDATTSRAPVKISARQREIGRLVTEIAREVGRSPSQVAHAWICQQRRFGAIIPIIGARSEKQLADNMGCLDFVLDEAHLAKLDEPTKIALGFPHDMILNPHMRQNAHGQHLVDLDNHRA